jgi:DNA repair protein RecN (Recombination protein N)
MQTGRLLQEMERIDPAAGEFSQMQQQALGNTQELLSGLARYGDKIQIDPARLAAIEERLNLIHSLKRKYGRTIGEINVFGDEALGRLKLLESRGEEVARLDADISRCERDALNMAAQLTVERRSAAPKLTKAALRELTDLGFRQSSFGIDLSRRPQLEPSGLDAVEFQFAPNPGEPARPLRAIASSGELARVMLALKTALAAEDDVPLLVFDEVDANVGGETAHVVGQKMKQISRRRQVLCITHLPQVAVHAGAHYMVSKAIRSGRTESQVSLLDPSDRLDEIARMLGGGAAARHHAEEMLAACR